MTKPRLNARQHPSADARDPAIRSVVRALHLLRTMNTQPVWSLHALHLATGLPKATLSRLLATLQQEGYARPDAAAGVWRLTAQVQELGGAVGEAHELVDKARPLLLSVTRKIKWPLALGLLDVDAIVVRFSSMPYSPLAVHTTTLGHRLGLIDSAMGRAYLAFCAPATRAALLAHLSASAPPSQPLPRGWVERDLAAVRLNGFAVRQPNAERGTATLAVPVVRQGDSGEEAVAVLAMTTFGTLMDKALIEAHAPVLIQTAARLTARG